MNSCIAVSSLVRYALLLAGATAKAVQGAGTDTVKLVIDCELPASVQHAVSRLTAALKHRGLKVTSGASTDSEACTNVVVGFAGGSRTLGGYLAARGLTVPASPESLLIARVPGERPMTILLGGHDARGLAYAVLEAAEAIRHAPRDDNPLEAVREVCESPYLRVRSVTTQIFNEDLERPWYGSEAYWHWFFGMLARNRFNNFSLTFGHNTNYMVPPYAWLCEVPGYPDVRVAGMGDAERSRNLRTFQRIGEIACEHGVDFTLGLWTQLPVLPSQQRLDYGESPVENLPTGAKGGDYCAKGLRRLLELCPAVTGVQLRMNLESGIPHEQQEAYYQSQFDAIAACGRPVRLDLRYKGLSQRTIGLAQAAGLDPTVSTKFWCEHMGLPYHPTWQDPAYSESRYGYGAMLRHPRPYRVVYRLWNVGTSRLLLWGDPEYASRFARSCTLGGGEGFEIFAPLANKGYGNVPGQWRVLADTSLEHYTWEYERYWATFLSFGRYGYNPDTPAVVWERELAGRFGTSWPHLDKAYREASRILPLITATTQFSASCWRFWPEMVTCLHLDAYRAIQPSDQSQFYAIAPWGSRQNWRAEGWASKHSAFVEDVVADNLNSKWTPIEVSARLSQLADATLSALDAARAGSDASGDIRTAEAAATELDLRVLAHIARYHASKKLAATHLEFFRLTSERARLPFVWKHIKESQKEWERIVALTEGKYRSQMVFGFSSEHYSDYPDRLHLHVGHWRDRLADVQADVDFVAGLLGGNDAQLSAGINEAGGSLQRFAAESPLRRKPLVEHERVLSAVPGREIDIVARVTSDEPLRDVSVYFRAMDQTRAWKRIPMARTEGGVYRASIPGQEVDASFDMLYYLEARVAHGGTFWPDWTRETPYVVVQVRR